MKFNFYQYLKKRIHLCLLFWSILVASASANDLLEFSLEELLQIKVCGPTLTFENLLTSPASVSVYTHSEIKRLGIDSLDELFNLTPGFQSYRSSNSSIQTLYSSRGRRVSGTGSDMLMLVDGQRIDSPRTSGNNVIVPKFSLLQVESVEFIRGPGSALYGSNAMTGVINIKTRSNQNEFGISYGSFNRKKAHVLFSDAIGELKFNFFAHMDSDDGDDYKASDGFNPIKIKTSDPRSSEDYNFKLSWKDTQLNFQCYSFDAQQFYESGYIANEYNERDGNMRTLSLKQNLNWGQIESYVWLSYHEARTNATLQIFPEGIFTNLSSPSSSEPFILKMVAPAYSETRIHWHNDWTINENHFMQYGVEFRHLDVPQYDALSNYNLQNLVDRNFPIPHYDSISNPTPIQAASKRDILGVYAQYQIDFKNSDSYLTVGSRYDEFSGIGSQTSPRFTFVKEFAGENSIKFLYGKAFRAPTEDELNLQNNPVFFGNPNLKPETVQSYEFIWIQNWESVNLSIGLFENHYESTIVQADIGNGMLQFGNWEDGRSRGVEFELFSELGSHILIRANHTRLLKKPELSFTEANTFSSISINFHQGSFNLNLTTTHTGKREMPALDEQNRRIQIDAYWNLFAKASYDFSNNFELFIQGKNLLNESYSTPPITSTLKNGIPSRGRECLIGGTFKF